MFDTLLIGTSGLLGHAKGLRVVGNNLSNVNTPGFKSSQMQFGSLFDQNAIGQQAQTSNYTNRLGTGVETLGSITNFQAGTEQGTTRPLDVLINGNGFFTVKRGNETLYTRSGEFSFDKDGNLVNAAKDRVQSLTGGKLSEISISSVNRNPAKATTLIKVTGNLAYQNQTALNDIQVIDASGAVAFYKMSFAYTGGGVDTAPTTVTVTVRTSADVLVGTGTLTVTNGIPAPAQLTISSFAPKVDFGSTLFATTTSLAFGSQDGYGHGILNDQSINTNGVLQLKYSNGQTVDGPRLAMANFDTDQDLEQLAGGFFAPKSNASPTYGFAGEGTFGGLKSGFREGSNVDLAAEFGNLILMQRGYQASSHVISTANDMIQALFDMKGR